LAQGIQLAHLTLGQSLFVDLLRFFGHLRSPEFQDSGRYCARARKLQGATLVFARINCSAFNASLA
ncbi:MAG: hypothetical protein RLN99_08560, partial [Kiloniellaceae bacterium]